MVNIDLTSDKTLHLAIDRFWETFPSVWDMIRGNIRAIATENFEITVEQFHILRHIRKGRGSVSELAEVKQISRSAISQAVDVLVDKGLITRQTKPEDRRYVTLELTKNGNDLLNAIFERNRAWMMIKMASLSQEELNNINRAMELLKKTFDQAKA
jgi:DNA-binding MarR family transcriptional regulator